MTAHDRTRPPLPPWSEPVERRQGVAAVVEVPPPPSAPPLPAAPSLLLSEMVSPPLAAPPLAAPPLAAPQSVVASPCPSYNPASINPVSLNAAGDGAAIVGLRPAEEHGKLLDAAQVRRVALSSLTSMVVQMLLLIVLGLVTYASATSKEHRVLVVAETAREPETIEELDNLKLETPVVLETPLVPVDAFSAVETREPGATLTDDAAPRMSAASDIWSMTAQSKLPFTEGASGGSGSRGSGLRGSGDGGGLGEYGSFGSRLKLAGAQGGEIQISLIWFNRNDLDLHVFFNRREHIYFADRNGRSGGRLDVDMNAGTTKSEEPVENVFWPEGRAPKGNFEVYVDHFFNHGGRDPTKYEVAVYHQGKVQHFTGSISPQDRPQRVHVFQHK